MNNQEINGVRVNKMVFFEIVNDRGVEVTLTGRLTGIANGRHKVWIEVKEWKQNLVHPLTTTYEVHPPREVE